MAIYNRLDLSAFVSSLQIAVNCGHPGKPRHGNITESGFTYQKVVSFSCNKYFELQGDRTRQCQADGIWSGEQPKCIASKLLKWVWNLDLKKICVLFFKKWSCQEILISPIAYCLYAWGREVPYGLNLIGRFEKKGSGKIGNILRCVFILSLFLVCNHETRRPCWGSLQYNFFTKNLH